MMGIQLVCLQLKMAMCQFRDNSLIATDCPRTNQAALVETIRTIHKTAWGLEVECDCVTPQQTRCTGGCCSPGRTAVGVVMTLCPPREGCAFSEPVALKPDWSLH